MKCLKPCLQPFVDLGLGVLCFKVEYQRHTFQQNTSVLRSAGHFHAKMLVVDPHTAPRGWITTANFNRALHASVDDRAAWFEITDDVAQQPGPYPGFGAPARHGESKR